jgi:hypothetical protein
MKDKIKSIHNVNGKKIVVLYEREQSYKPKKKRKAKSYFSKIRNSK